MPSVGQIEKKTQERVLALLSQRLGYTYLGDWIDRPANSNIEPERLKAWLASQGVSDALAARALFELQKAAFDTSKSLYDRNHAVYRLLRYGVKVRPEAGENTITVWLVKWADPLANEFAVAEEVTVPGGDLVSGAKASTKRPDVVLYVNGIALGVLELKRSTVSVSEGMRALRLELSAATHFARRSRRLTWPAMTGGGTFDLLVDDVGPDGLEVECKSIGEDKGRKVHKRGALDFYGLLWPHLQPTIKGLQIGLSAVLTLQGRLPERHAQRVDLARGFARAIFAGKSTALPDGSGVRISEFDPAVLGDIPNGVQPSEARATIDQVSETRNRQTMVVGTHAGGALALTLQSSQDDALMKAIFDTLSDSAGRQFSGTRGAMFLVGLHGLGGDQLFSVAQQDQDVSQTPTALRIAVSRFLSGEGRDHVVGVGFLSESGLQPLEAGLVESGGTAYYFPKRESPKWSDDFSGLFTWNHPNAQPRAGGLGSSP